MRPALVGLAGACQEAGPLVHEVDVEDHARDGTHVPRTPGRAAVEGFHQRGRPADPSAGPDRHDLAVLLQDVERTDADDRRTRGRSDRRPGRAGIMRHIQWMPIRNVGKVARSDIAHEGGVRIGELQGPHIGAGLAPRDAPVQPAVRAAVDAPGPVAVEAEVGAGKGDRVLFVVEAVGFRLDLVPDPHRLRCIGLGRCCRPAEKAGGDEKPGPETRSQQHARLRKRHRPGPVRHRCNGPASLEGDPRPIRVTT